MNRISGIYKTKKALLRQLSTLLLIASFLLLTSCQGFLSDSAKIKQHELFAKLTKKARNAGNYTPDSTLCYADSAYNIAVKANFKDTALIEIFQIRSGFYSNNGQLDSAVSELQKIITIGEKHNDSTIIAKAYKGLGEVYVNHQDLDKSEKYFTSALHIYQKLKKEQEVSQIKIHLADVLTMKGNIPLSQKYLMEVFKHKDSIGDEKGLSIICISIANNFKAIESMDNAIQYYKKAFYWAAKFSDSENMFNALNDLGICYRFTKPDSAINYYNQALQYLQDNEKNVQEIIVVKYNLANIYYAKKNFNKATNIYDSILQICRDKKIPDGVARIYSHKAHNAEDEGNIKESVKYVEAAIRICDSIKNNNLKLALMNQLSQIYRNAKDHKSALEMSDKVNALKDSIMDSDKKIEIHKMEQQYQSEKKVIENANLKMELAHQKDLLLYRTITIFGLALAIIVLCILLWITNRLYRQRGNAYHVLMDKYKEEFNLSGTNKDFESTEDSEEKRQAGMELAEQILKYYRDEAPYLNPKFRVEDIATKLNTSQRVIGNILRCYHNTSFFQLTNQFRVEEAKKRMASKEYKNYKTEVIALESGFGSVQSFYRAFEQFVGVKPAYFRESILEIAES